MGGEGAEDLMMKNRRVYRYNGRKGDQAGSQGKMRRLSYKMGEVPELAGCVCGVQLHPAGRTNGP